MPLPNRVDPKGNILSVAARGAWMGNRGQLHGRTKQILRPFRLKAWITCLLEFKGWHRAVMAPNQYTELFFLDEATALAAGHRPCFECRRADYQLFKICWISGNPHYSFNEKTSIKEIDEIMHRDRINARGEKITFDEDVTLLPDGTFVLADDEPHLLWEGILFRWTPFGYAKGKPLPVSDVITVLTPLSTVNAIRNGYKPQVAI